MKTIAFPEKTRLQFRAEFFNFLNHTNFVLNQPGTDMQFPATFGFPDQAQDPRQIQFGLKFYYEDPVHMHAKYFPLYPATNDKLVPLKERTMTRKQRTALYSLALSLFALATYAQELTNPPASPNTKGRIFAQALIEKTLSKHPGLAGVGLATTQAQGQDCVTIADTDPKELGDKCDKGELAVMRSGKSTVEKETDGYDVTLPFHVGGKTIGIIAMDFKLDEKAPGLLDRAKVIAGELEAQIPEKSKLFEQVQ